MTTLFSKLHELAYRPYIATDSHKPAAFADLSAVAGYTIPQVYMDFLREFPNTGVFAVEGDVFIQGKEKLSGRHNGCYAIDMLYAACSDKQYDLVTITGRPVYDGDTPKYAMLIGQDLGGNAFCLDLRPDTFGKVYFWDHDSSNSEKQGLYLLADDFASFVSCLQVDA